MKTIAHVVEGDIADELMREFRVDSSVLCRSVMAAPWGFGVGGREVGSFHMVLEGHGWLEVAGLPGPIPVSAGDILVLPKGDAHRVKDSPMTAAPSLTSILAEHNVVDGELRFGGRDGPVTEIVCGVFTLDDLTVAPWADRLPSVVRSRLEPEGSDWRAATVVALRDEARAPTSGGAAVVNRLLESLLVDALRSELADGGARSTTGDGRGANRRIGRALAGIHEHPEAPWSVGDLSELAVMSRSTFSERFRAIVGEPPMRYVRSLRLARAARRLRSTDATVAEIARGVGYASEEALSRAFKVRFGEAPTFFRRRARLPE